jgi:iron complex transport system ATP-binding protein
MTALLEAHDVRVAAGGDEILRGAELMLERGQLVAIVGPNGAGKSTFVRALAGLQSTRAGSIRWRGEALQSMRARALALTRAFIPQRPTVPAGVSVREAVAIGRSPHLKPLQRATRDDHRRVDQAMARAGALEFADRMLPTLSGGELQRVQIALALAQETPVLMADEPTSHLDLGMTVSVAKLLRGLADDGLGVLLVVHDLALATAIADTVVVMSNGRSVAHGPPCDVLDPARLRAVWNVEASLEARDDGRTALNVDWLAAPGAPT